MADSFHEQRRVHISESSGGERARRFEVVRRSPEGAEELLQGEEASFAALGERIAILELQLREQLEIERMRDLELGRLEAELEQKSQRLQSVDDTLFHERRRSAELERRWNVLASSYEQTAASLVETGATLMAIASQRSYRLSVNMLRMIGRHRSKRELLDKLERPGLEDTSD